MKQRSLMNFFGKPGANSTKPAGASTLASTPPSKSVSSRPVCSQLAGGPVSSDIESSVKDTPPTSEPIDVDMLSDEQGVKSAVRAKSTRHKRKILIADSDDDQDEMQSHSVNLLYTASLLPNIVRGHPLAESTPDRTAYILGRTKKPRMAILSSDEEQGDVPSFGSRLSRFKKSPVKRSRSSHPSSPVDADFIVPDDFDEEPRGRSSSCALSRRSSSARSSGRSSYHEDEDEDEPKTKRSAPGRPTCQKSTHREFQRRRLRRNLQEDPFSFLSDVRDKDGVRPGEPGYDPRTLYIPKKVWVEFTPFEKQVVGALFELTYPQLYEEDARIGHREFDLKLTHRVKMSMVGVPETSFNFWAAKFLAKGYKVGRVDQSETALGAEMRVAKSKGKPTADKGKEKIVRRELNKVYTNGTLVDEELLTDEQAGHCISIREDLDAKKDFDQAAAAKGGDLYQGSTPLLVPLLLKCCLLAWAPKGNLSVATVRLLKAILPSSCLWTSLRDVEGFTYEQTFIELNNMFSGNEDVSIDEDGLLNEAVPTSIRDMAGL
ncbi:muts domain I-domain-containing protein [Butyriboletus roseoflavus]|nr:muts domain I-domain-containing protein [Butyriboletus roseoflavus]